jgi:hypothetical protein
MRRTILTAAVATTLLAGVLLGNGAEAMPLAAPSALGAAAAERAVVQQVVAVCGTNGCVKVQTSGPKRRRTHP